MKKVILICYLLVAIVANNFSQSDMNISNNLANLDGEPSIAINPTNPNNIIAAWMRLKPSDGKKSIAYKRSLDGGQTWSSVNYISKDTIINEAADVVIAFHDSVAYLSCVYFRLDSGDIAGAIYLSKSTDGGLTWSIPNMVIGLPDNMPDYPFDRPWMTIDNSGGINDGTIYITTMSALLITGQPGQVHTYLRSSMDGGSTWGSIEQVDDSSHSAGSLKVPYGVMSVGGDGKLYIAYISWDTAAYPLPRFYVATTTDRGNTFQRYAVNGYVLAGAGKLPFYSISANPVTSGEVVLSWCDTRNDTRDILLSKSTDGGQTWSATPLRVNDDLLGNNIIQDQVWSAFSPSGNKLALAWRDRRMNDTASTSPFDIYMAVSIDGGDSFLPNYRLSSTSYQNPVIPCCNSFNGLALTDSILVADWGGYTGGAAYWDIYFNKTDISTLSTGVKENLSDANSDLQVFPNPTNSETTIQFSLSESQFVELKLMNVKGEEIKSLIKNELNKGKHSVILDTKNISSGIYYLRFMQGKTVIVNKLIVSHVSQQ